MGKSIPRLARPYDREAMDRAFREEGAVVLTGAYTAEECDTYVEQVRTYLDEHPDEKEYAANSLLAQFQGETTVTMHQLIGAIDCAPAMVLHRDIVDAARRLLAPLSETILLIIAEYMGRYPGAPRQQMHRDTFSWQHAPFGENPVALSVMCAMSDFTKENGATWVVPGAHSGSPVAPPPDWSEAVQVEMTKGDALLFRQDLFHAGGANTTESDVRHILSFGYQVGWLRQVENSLLSVPPEKVREFDPELQELLGYSHELVLGLYKGGPPQNALKV
ncbi:phytanoyl-CoA dioxygenase family protein [Actinokineospora sp. UTMC 2448]|uniref:phytanoyl-CoA dioxygenase family protein n=1 Tax=Actinokineospora sp. UTMC 2448 TaxID=2268449 RepID=UPI002164CE36|nr:phytanoyl-CoA dioxygenase family protein [Actinokineospora sp. UTMC 2448]UVS79245.1 chlorinating enzyme [Actinokineospora sp. UTMC 2448]